LTVNCRGLGNINKFRLLLNKAYEITKLGPAIVLLQETMIVHSTYLDMAWRGKYVHTPGLGNSQGCITLMGDAAKLTDIVHLNNRAHTFKVQGLLDQEVLVANVYAPIGYDDAKIQFFQEVFDQVRDYAGENVVLTGDFNITLDDSDRSGRLVGAGETRVARIVVDHITDCGLTDTWNGRSGHTWRRGTTLSRLDRVLVRLNDYRV
jgi:exonuclease III